MRARWIVIVASGALAACGGARARDVATGAASEGPTEAKTSLPGDAGAPRACTFDPKATPDLAPCFEDCDRGVAVACRMAAERLERGEGAPHDPSRALALEERACELRDPAACAAAARFVGRGVGVRVDRARQLDLLARACLLGEALSCAVPARAYASGEAKSGVDADPRRAAALAERACLGGIEEACEALADAGP